MFIQEFLPRFLVFLGSCTSLAIIDLSMVGVVVVEVDVVKHVARDMVSSESGTDQHI